MANDTETSYQPKHLKQYQYYKSHCCFSGCTPMGCPGGCCVYAFGHESYCPLNTGNELGEAHHDVYVRGGGREHLRADVPRYSPSHDWGALPPLADRTETSLLCEHGFRNPCTVCDPYISARAKAEGRSVSTPPPPPPRCGCGDIKRYPNGCGPSGCQNSPA